MALKNFGREASAVVVGASGGIGRAFVAELARDAAIARVFALSRSGGPVGDAEAGRIDITDEDSVAACAARLHEDGVAPRLVLVATGVLHDGDDLQPEKTWADIDPASMARAFAVNASGPALVAKHLLPLLPRRERSVFAVLSARVGSIADNRLGGWVAYRASKAALNMIVRTLAIELARRRPQAIIAGLHPGTVNTRLSRPFQSNVPPGKLFRADDAARRLLDVVDGLGRDDSGRVYAYDGSPVPF